MSRYLDRCGGCFASGDVVLADGGRKPIQDVQPGDRLKGGVVKCVVEMRFPANQPCPTVDLGGGVVVTPWHPVRSQLRSPAWAFPSTLARTELRTVYAVYSLLLESGSAFTIGEWDAVALGHELHDPVAAHAFFGSRAAVEQSLAPMLGYARGRVVLRADCMVRSADNLVCGFRPDAELLRQHAHPVELLLAQQLETLTAEQKQRLEQLAMPEDDGSLEERAEQLEQRARGLAQLHAEWSRQLQVCA